LEKVMSYFLKITSDSEKEGQVGKKEDHFLKK